MNIKIVKDFVLNFLAVASTTVVTQLLFLPTLSRLYSAEVFGIILVIIGVANTIILTFGGSLNNTRLLVNSVYKKKNSLGDFQILLFIGSVLGAFSILMYIFRQLHINNFVLTIMLLFFVVFGIVRNYALVSFRLKLNYINNLLCNIAISFGIVFGILFLYFGLLEIWVIPFIIGELVGVLFIWKESNILKEPLVKTNLFLFSAKKYLILVLSTLSGNILIYLDRILLFPMLGGEAVSIYVVAAFFGKCLGIAFSPLAGVLLSYYAQSNFLMNQKKFWETNVIVATLAVLFYILSLFVSEPVTKILYPYLFNNASHYIKYANLAAVIETMAGMVQAAVLKYAKTYWQIIVTLVHGSLYLVSGIYGAGEAGLLGFSCAAIFASLCKLLLLYAIGHFSLKKSTRAYRLH